MQANIDEYYLLRVHRGLKGTIAFNGKQFKLKVSKVYPVVKNGQFKVDMSFVSNLSKGLIRGQSLNIRLALSDETDQALLLPRGGFYQQTGGSWVYKITDGGKKAVKQPIGLGRQNPNYFEVLSGLQPGDKVIISSYNTFGNHRTLNLE